MRGKLETCSFISNMSFCQVGQMSEAKSAHSITTLNFTQFCE